MHCTCTPGCSSRREGLTVRNASRQVVKKHPEVVKVLMTKGANATVQTCTDCVARLSQTAGYDCANIGDCASLQLKDSKGQTAWDLAVGNDELLAALKTEKEGPKYGKKKLEAMAVPPPLRYPHQAGRRVALGCPDGLQAGSLLFHCRRQLPVRRRHPLRRSPRLVSTCGHDIRRSLPLRAVWCDR